VFGCWSKKNSEGRSPGLLQYILQKKTFSGHNHFRQVASNLLSSCFTEEFTACVVWRFRVIDCSKEATVWSKLSTSCATCWMLCEIPSCLCWFCFGWSWLGDLRGRVSICFGARELYNSSFFPVEDEINGDEGCGACVVGESVLFPSDNILVKSSLLELRTEIASSDCRSS
jgi:hypothetical protein